MKVAVFNEEQLRSWHPDDRDGPRRPPAPAAGRSRLGVHRLTQAQAKAIDGRYLQAARQAAQQVDGQAAASPRTDLPDAA